MKIQKWNIYSIQIGFRELSKAKSRIPITKIRLMSKLGVVIFIHNKEKNCLQSFLMKLWVKRTSIKTEKLFGLSIYRANLDLVIGSEQ